MVSTAQMASPNIVSYSQIAALRSAAGLPPQLHQTISTLKPATDLHMSLFGVGAPPPVNPFLQQQPFFGDLNSFNLGALLKNNIVQNNNNNDGRNNGAAMTGPQASAFQPIASGSKNPPSSIGLQPPPSELFPPVQQQQQGVSGLDLLQQQFPAWLPQNLQPQQVPPFFFPPQQFPFPVGFFPPPPPPQLPNELGFNFGATPANMSSLLLYAAAATAMLTSQNQQQQSTHNNKEQGGNSNSNNSSAEHY